MGSVKGGIVAAVAAAIALALPAAAFGSERIGDTGNTSSCTDDEAYVPTALVGPPSYSPSAYGVITEWVAAADEDPNQSLQLIVVRQDGPGLYSIVAKDVVRTLTVLNGGNPYAVRLPIEANQTIGVYLPLDSNAPCEFSTGSDDDHVGYSVPFNVGIPPDNTPWDYSSFDSGERVNAQALVEPDADRDGFGDETQDQCPSNASTHGPCPAHKKCKKHKKKQSASAAKKHCKKKKKKR
jgi:hypothetical protein